MTRLGERQVYRLCNRFTNAEIDDYLAKLVAFETNPSLNKLQIINDNKSDPNGTWENAFSASTAWYNANFSSSAYELEHVDLTQVSGAEANTSIMAALNVGMFYQYYIGHSLTTAWAAELILSNNDIPNLAP